MCWNHFKPTATNATFFDLAVQKKNMSDNLDQC